jgi:hypothetical protein
MTHPNINDGPMPCRPIALTFRSPEFEAQEMSYGNWSSIGSGAESYEEELQEFGNPMAWGRFMNAEVDKPGGFAAAAASAIYLMIQDKPDPKVSPLIQLSTVRQQTAEICTVRHKQLSSRATILEWDKAVAQNLCRTEDELRRHMKKLGCAEADLLSAEAVGLLHGHAFDGQIK